MKDMMKHSKKWLVILLLALAIVPAVAEAQTRSGGTFRNDSLPGGINSNQCRDELAILYERFREVQIRITNIVDCNRNHTYYDSGTGGCTAERLSPNHSYIPRTDGDRLAFYQTDGSLAASVRIGGPDGADATDATCGGTPPTDPADCQAPWGATVSDGGRVRAYQAASVPNGQTCNSEWRNCTDGDLDGSYQYPSCVVGDPPVGPASCDLPWGGTIADGGQVQAFESDSVASTATCNSEMRECTDGRLSGSFTHRSCSNRDPVTTCSNLRQWDQDGWCQTGVGGREIPYCNHFNMHQKFCNNGAANCTFGEFNYLDNSCRRCEVTYTKCVTQ